MKDNPHMKAAAQLLPVEPFDLVVFGAAGDLSLRKLIPSLFHRWRDGQIPKTTRIIGVSRNAMSAQAFRDLALKRFQIYHPDEIIDAMDWEKFSRLLHYVALDVGEQGEAWGDLQKLFDGPANRVRIFYLALPPAIYGAVCKNIAWAGLKTGSSRVVLEKPIGHDLASARAINDAVGAVFEEKKIFRIDHYLGKETVQNLIVLRFMNSIFEPVWNANAIDHVQITVAENIGIEGRGNYYGKAGALRDMVQNHLLQLLCLVSMEPPFDLDADIVRDEKIKVLRALRPITPANIREVTVRGHYEQGATDGVAVAGYGEDLGAEINSETFVALKANIDNWRWKGVPFYLRTGKRMQTRRSEIIIQFKDVAHNLINVQGQPPEPTRLVIRLQPDEGMQLLLVTKDPGPGGMRLRYVPLNLSYAEAFEARYPDAYERLLMAIVRGDLGLFMRRDEVETAWQWVDGILTSWQKDATPIHGYAAGTDGPVQSALLLDRDKREWYDAAAE
jgi:glucose-6-phosphate 1-dehydrogenase